MVGPVLHQEMLLGSRRSRLHVFRWAYAAWLILQVFYFYFAFLEEESARYLAYRTRNLTAAYSARNRVSAPEVVGSRFAEAFVSQQMILLALAVPAFVAGAVTDEKRRGTLQYLLVSGLESRHILLGKLLGRVAQVLLVALGGLPLFALLAGFGGVEPLTLLLTGLVLVVPLLALASAALLASVWCRQTRDAVLGLYVLGVLGWLVVRGLGGAFNSFSPVYVLGPVWGPPGTWDLAEAGRRLAGAAVGWGTLGAVCLGLAVWRLRPAYVRELESTRPGGGRWYSPERAPVDDEPVQWRERHVEGLAPTRGLRRVPPWLGITLVAVATALSSLAILAASLAPGQTFEDVLRALVQLRPGQVAGWLPDAGPGFLIQSLVVMLLASLVVGIRTSGAITGERERQTWEALLLTPLSARQLVRGKLWGIMGASYWYLLAYAAPAVTLSAFGGLWALFWTVTWLAVTVLAMYFVGAAGLWCSVRSKNSWRSLLGTLALGYVGGTALYVITTPLIWILAGLLLLLLLVVDAALGTKMSDLVFSGLSIYFVTFFIASCIALAVIFWLMARRLLSRAQRWIADRERTRHWHEEPLYRRSRRPATRPRLLR
jgi:ABC-type transport system involved in multi-copper enzyme maturation permease subunit